MLGHLIWICFLWLIFMYTICDPWDVKKFNLWNFAIQWLYISIDEDAGTKLPVSKKKTLAHNNLSHQILQKIARQCMKLDRWLSVDNGNPMTLAAWSEMDPARYLLIESYQTKEDMHASVSSSRKGKVTFSMSVLRGQYRSTTTYHSIVACGAAKGCIMPTA
jgi:hypothetical protein